MLSHPPHPGQADMQNNVEGAQKDQFYDVNDDPDAGSSADNEASAPPRELRSLSPPQCGPLFPKAVLSALIAAIIACVVAWLQPQLGNAISTKVLNNVGSAHRMLSSFTLGGQQKPIHNIFVGNPGAGKSSLFNALVGEPLFDAGIVVDGIGRTKSLTIRNHSGVLYMDTPGLDDLQLREQAARAITQALKTVGSYRVVFVLTLNSGRVRPEDLTTMKLVLEAAPITHYGIILNKIESSIANRYRSNATLFDDLKVRLMGNLPQICDRVHIVDWSQQLHGKENAVWEDVSGVKALRSFMDSIPSLDIDAGNVLEIKVKDYEKLIQEQEHNLAELRKVNEEMKRGLEKLGKAKEAEAARIAALEIEIFTLKEASRSWFFR